MIIYIYIYIYVYIYIQAFESAWERLRALWAAWAGLIFAPNKMFRRNNISLKKKKKKH